MKLTNKIILLFIILTATILRFYNYLEIPLTHDEFSALFRLRFDSFSELIDQGVKVDGHPAGIQVFLYYWTKLFGDKAWVIKLPFTLFGIASIYLIFLIGKKWFNETVGLLSSAFLASIQFTVMYSQIARPYISGMFFALLMVLYWTNLIKNPKQNFIWNGIGFILAADLCAYNHHFSLLFAAIVGLSGLFFIQRDFLRKYMTLGILIFVLYIPHLGIFFHQLHLGGVEEWLAKPRYDFLLNFIEYIFNFSYLSLFAALAIAAYGLKDSQAEKLNKKTYILFFSWFILPFLIGFFYSKYYSAVLQYSVLIFSFPFLFFLLFGHIKPQKERINLLLVMLILTVNIFSLIHQRNHYELFYQSPYKGILTDYRQAKRSGEPTLCIIDSHRKITRYYNSRLNIDTAFIWFDSFHDINAFKAFLDTNSRKFKQLYFGCLSSNEPLSIPLIQEYYPNIVWQKNYAGGTTYLFDKKAKETTKTLSCLNFENPSQPDWQSVDTSQITDSVHFHGNYAYIIPQNTEFGPSYTAKLNHLITNENNFIDISVAAKEIDRKSDIILVAVLEHNGQQIHWGGTNFKKFILENSDSKDNWINIHHTIKLSDADLSYSDIRLKIYIWNKGKNRFFIDDFCVKLREGNPVIYGLNEKIF